MTERERGALAAAVAGCMFGSSYVATAFQLHGVSPIGGALWRSALGSVVLIALLAWSAAGAGGSARPASMPPPLAGRLVRLAVLGVLGGLVFVTGMNVAVSRVGATVTAFVAGLYAVLAALFAPALLGERLVRRAVAGFGLALVGTALLAELSPSPETLGGLAAGAGAAVSYGLFLVLIRRWSTAIQIDATGVSFSAAIATTLGLGLTLAVLDPASAAPIDLTGSVVVATIWLAVVSAFGPLLVAAAMRRVEARVVSSFLLLNPITATILSAFLLGERPSSIQILGGLLVLVGMAATTDVVGAFRRRRRASPQEDEVGLPIA